MLKLVLGGSGSGKTTLLYARIKARAEAGQRSILLVPEQFTSSTEGRIYRELGDALSGMVDSYSFTSLLRAVQRCRPSRMRAVLCWCAARWKSCRTRYSIITATGAVRRSARWPLRPSTS